MAWVLRLALAVPMTQITAMDARNVEERRVAADSLSEWMMCELPKGTSRADSESSRGGFDGRAENWKRNLEDIDSNPPPVEGTLRAPKEGTRPVGPVVISPTSGKTRPP